MRLSEKVAIITGSASGIGEATAIKFAREGAKVAVCDINMAEAQRVADEIVEDGGTALAFRIDVTDTGWAPGPTPVPWPGPVPPPVPPRPLPRLTALPDRATTPRPWPD